ncbi:MAG: FxLYD domain-containing protein [Chloroflexi bacterium]|nr:FxLYD domain-containing protein [Chloroflexota bacterium]
MLTIRHDILESAMIVRYYTIIVALAFMAFCIFPLQAACISASNLKIIDSQLTAREFTGDLNIKSSMAVVSGTAKNSKDSSINNCVISVIFYDAQKNNIGVASATRQSLDAGETWNFIVQLTSSDAWKARSYDINTSDQ